MPQTKKCEYCKNTTKKALIDLDEGWTAFSIGRSKTKIYCPKHAHLVVGDMTKGIKERV